MDWANTHAPIVDLIFLLLRDRKLKEILRQCELTVDVLLRDSKALYVEETHVVDSMFKLFRQTLFAARSTIVL
jgi:hypothetical protein